MFMRNEKQENVRIRKRKFLCFFLAVMVALSSMSPAIAWAARSFDLNYINDDKNPVDFNKHKIVEKGDTVSFTDLTEIKYTCPGGDLLLNVGTIPTTKEYTVDKDYSDFSDHFRGDGYDEEDFLGWKIRGDVASGRVTKLHLQAVFRSNDFYDYKIIFDTKGATTKIPYQIISEDNNGDSTSEPDIPTDNVVWSEDDTDHRFGNWYYTEDYSGDDALYSNDNKVDKEDGEGNFVHIRDHQVTLYAKWFYRVNYYLRSGVKGSEEDTLYAAEFVEYGNKARRNIDPTISPITPWDMVEDPEWEGHTFLGWFDKDGKKWFDPVTGSDKENKYVATDDAPPVTAPTDLFAHWTYTVSFDSRGGTDVKQQTVSENETATRPEDPKRDNREFDNWYKEATLNTPYDFAPVTEDITLYAGWDCMVTYKGNGGTTDDDEEEVELPVHEGKRADDPADLEKVFTREGYTLSYWHLEGNKEKKYKFDGSDTPVTDPITLVAEWEPAAYKISYELDGGTNDADNPATYTFGTGVTSFKDPTKAGGYKFDGWYKEAAYTNKITSISGTETGDITLYAKWTKEGTVGTEHTVKFDTDGGSAIADQTVADGDTATKPADPSKDGFTFEYWYLADPGIEYDFGNTVTSDITLHAKWKENGKKDDDDDKWTVTFDTRGGSAIAPVKVAKDTAAAPPKDPTKEGDTFDYWCSDKDLKNKYDFSTPVTGNITLYAKWKSDKSDGDDDMWTVTFDTRGGSTIAPVKVAKDTAAAPPEDPTKDGDTFDGWYSDKELKNKYDFKTPVTGNITLYAGWKSDRNGENGENGKNNASGDGLFIPFDTTGNLLQAAIVKRTANSLTVSWNKITGADGYLIFGRKCHHFPIKKIADITDPNTFTFTQENLKPIKGDPYYKYQVRAYKKVGNRKKIIARSLLIHGCLTGGGKYTVAKGVSVNQAKSRKNDANLTKVSGNYALSVKVGQKVKITAEENSEETGGNISIDGHRKQKNNIQYQTNDKGIAKVTLGGRVKVKAPGKCTIYAVAQNGMLTPIQVTVE